MSVKFTDNSEQAMRQMASNKQAALAAMGIEAVGLIVTQMESGYQDPHPNLDMNGNRVGGTHTDIRYTGDLIRDVNSEVGNSSPDTVDVGNSLDYAPHVHEGTSKLKGRPYIRDAITSGKDRLKEVASNQLKRGY